MGRQLDPAVLDAVAHLPEHRRVLEATLEFFRADPDAVAAFVAGSVARGEADEHSDLDLGICFAGTEARERAWDARWNWEIAPWFHRFDADHVRPYFVIYLFEPGVKTDIPLYLPKELPPPTAYRIAWDQTGRLGGAAEEPAAEVDWAPAVHEDERFWAWLFYCVVHIRRGEFYDVATDFFLLRDIVEQWHARLAGRPAWEQRRAELRERAEDLANLAECFPRPERESLKRALLKLISIHERQRDALGRRLAVEWRTSDEARTRIRSLVETL